MICENCGNEMTTFQPELFDPDRGYYVCCGYSGRVFVNEKQLVRVGAGQATVRFDTELL